MKEYIRDGWNWVHLFGSCVLTIFLSKFMQPVYAGIVAWILGFMWELCDKANKRFNWNIWFLDPGGCDWRDWLIMDLVGIVLALILAGG